MIQDFSLFEKPDRPSKVIKSIHKGEKVDSIEPIIRILKFGEVEVVSDSKDNSGLKKRDRLSVITSSGEGFYSACFKGKLTSIDPTVILPYNDEKDYISQDWENIR